MGNKQKHSISWFKAGIVLLLNLAILLNLALNSFHDLLEHQHSFEQVCNEEFEKDACHRYLVHHEKSSSCNKTHKHLTEKTDDCFVCKYFKQRTNEGYVTDHTFSFFLSYHEVQFSFPELNLKSDFFALSCVRGPPVYTL